MKKFLGLVWSISMIASAHAAIEVPAPDAIVPKGGYSYEWTGCDNCKAPESAYFDAETQSLFISNVVGAPDQKDGQGWIQKLDATGRVIAAKWVEGLDAPKGMRSYKGTLWVSDIDQIVAIDMASGKITSKHVIPGAKFLNDVAVDAKGTVYVSDTAGSRIYKLEGGQHSVFVEGKEMDSPNGLLVVGDSLIVASWGSEMQPDWSTKVPGKLFKISLKNRKKALITRKPLGNLDGLELEASGNFLVSDWMAGKIFRVTPKGKSTELFRGMKGSADIGYVAASQLLVIPRMGENQITAYDLRKYPKP